MTTSTSTATYTAEQTAWLKTAYTTIKRILRKQGSFHVNDFWDNKATTPFPGTRFTDARVLGGVFRRAVREGLMVNESPDSGHRVYKNGKATSTYKPVYTSLIRK